MYDREGVIAFILDLRSKISRVDDDMDVNAEFV